MSGWDQQHDLAGLPGPRHVRVDALHVGDRFDWCGRAVEVLGVKPIARFRRKPGRWITVTERDGTTRALHYLDAEEVVRIQ